MTVNEVHELETWSLTFPLRFNLRQGAGDETTHLHLERLWYPPGTGAEGFTYKSQDSRDARGSEQTEDIET